MPIEAFQQYWQQGVEVVREGFSRQETFTQVGFILLIYAVAYVVANRVRRLAPVLDNAETAARISPVLTFLAKCGNLVFPLTALLLLRVGLEVAGTLLDQAWIVHAALTVATLLLFRSAADSFIGSATIARVFKLIGIPVLALHLLGFLDHVTAFLESIAISIGNIKLSLYGIVRLALFGTFLSWLGRESNRTSREILKRRTDLHPSTREVTAKLLEVAIFFVVVLLLLNLMGIDLTMLAVFGGAIGVGLGFGLQAIASNFISGLIILFDRSVTIGDYVEFEDGRAGTVREMDLRSTTLETFEGKDIVVPNEKFIVEPFTNWTHKDARQRYRVDFSVAYRSDIDRLVKIIKDVVATHPQVLHGEHLPIEYRPDCEIDSFGDSGVNMFVEFWMEGIDDGKNRVGGDLLLMIFNALREHGFEIPFPQREVRVLNEQLRVGPLHRSDP